MVYFILLEFQGGVQHLLHTINHCHHLSIQISLYFIQKQIRVNCVGLWQCHIKQTLRKRVHWLFKGTILFYYLTIAAKEE